jgi:hypothetical protein
MPCRHLTELFAVCGQHNLKLSSSDLIRIVCPACGISEECPSMLCDEYEGRHLEERVELPARSEGPNAKDN